ncbi:MAG: cell wall hydrolase [Desulfobulbaceae bacterium]|jgi:N-acetylmuramoyl-L-alanine amidase|nr:cell wall hydrolase [Desulfobulbaceae bacterium]
MGFLEGLFWLTLNIYHEARSEPPIGQLAVAHVTLNRAIQNNWNIEEVVREPYQFSWIFQKKNYVPTEADAFMECLQSAMYALTSEDFTGGATFYHRQDLQPEWSDDLVYVAQYGVHKFYRD